MNCKTASEHISAWLDNEIAPELHRELQDHYETCEKCQARVKFEGYSKSLVKSKLSHTPMPAELKTRIHAALEKESQRLTLWAFIKNYFKNKPVSAWGFSFATLVLVIMVTIMMPRPMEKDLSQNWIFASARDCYEHNSKPLTGYDFTEEDPALIVKGINDSHKRNFQVAFPAFQPADFKIHGCKYCELAGKPSIYLALKEDGHHVAIEIIPGTHENIPRGKPHRVNGETYLFASTGELNQLLWKKNNLVYVVTSDLPEEKLSKLITPELITYRPENETAHLAHLL